MYNFTNDLKAKKFYILHFTFYIIITPILLLLLSCTSSTEIEKGKLSSIVNLEGLTDHSGITISLYDLAYLDTTITRINSEYPQIGVIITQHTEFDHRLQSPIKTTTTEADGSFQIKNIPTGTYNFVAQKQGFGFRYIYEISISDGDNDLTEVMSQSHLNNEISNDIGNSIMKNVKCKMENETTRHSSVAGYSPERPVRRNFSEDGSRREGRQAPQKSNFKSSIFNFTLAEPDLILFPEKHISGDYINDITVQPFHHLVIDDDTNIHPDYSLTIMPDAVVRINPGCDLKIFGNFSAQGQQDHMFWVTSNHGFENDELGIRNYELNSINPDNNYNNSYLLTHNSTLSNRFEDIELYNSMSLETICTVQNDLIKWGKWDWGNIALKSNADITIVDNSCFNNNIISFQNIECEDIGIINCNVSDNSSENKGSIDLSFINNVNIENSIFIRSINGIKQIECTISNIQNCYLQYNVSKGLINYSNSNTTLSNCEIYSSTYGILNTGSILKVYYSKFQNRNCISDQDTYGITGESFIEIQNNNFSAELCAVRCTSWFHDGIEHVFNVTYNYWGSVIEEIIQVLIIDRNDIDPEDSQYDVILGIINYSPYNVSEIQDAGIIQNYK